MDTNAAKRHYTSWVSAEVREAYQAHYNKGQREYSERDRKRVGFLKDVIHTKDGYVKNPQWLLEDRIRRFGRFGKWDKESYWAAVQHFIEALTTNNPDTCFAYLRRASENLQRWNKRGFKKEEARLYDLLHQVYDRRSPVAIAVIDAMNESVLGVDFPLGNNKTAYPDVYRTFKRIVHDYAITKKSREQAEAQLAHIVSLNKEFDFMRPDAIERYVVMFGRRAQASSSPVDQRASREA